MRSVRSESEEKVHNGFSISIRSRVKLVSLKGTNEKGGVTLEPLEKEFWMDAATSEQDVIVARILQDYAAGRITAEQKRDKLNEIFAPQQSDILPPIEDVATLLSKPIILPEPVIENVAHRGEKLSIGGASKAFKTWILSDLAVSVATGTLWLGHFQTTRGRDSSQF